MSKPTLSHDSAENLIREATKLGVDLWVRFTNLEARMLVVEREQEQMYHEMKGNGP